MGGPCRPGVGSGSLGGKASGFEFERVKRTPAGPGVLKLSFQVLSGEREDRLEGYFLCVVCIWVIVTGGDTKFIPSISDPDTCLGMCLPGGRLCLERRDGWVLFSTPRLPVMS